MKDSTMKKAKRFTKRIFDITASGMLALVFAPLMMAVAVAIRWDLGRPAFFVQERTGRHGKMFRLYKFRTMTEHQRSDGEWKSDAERLTKLGRLLRFTSLDELPQLWNVLRGEMSLVGPRPLLPEYLDRYTSEQARRHEVLPGITGWAQIHGRQEIPFSRRLVLDVWYVDHWSLFLDLKILMLTAGKVITSQGVKPAQEVHEIDDIGLSGFER